MITEHDIKPFPIQKEWNWSTKFGKQIPEARPVKHHPHCQIPWWLAEEAYRGYVQLYGDVQSLERLAERGGFGRAELLYLLRAVKD